MTEEFVGDLPKDFGRYRILSKLGEGGMGSVYLAIDENLQRKVAIKTPFFENETDERTIKRFFREARAAATIHHPNVCAVYDVGEFAGRYYLTMAYIEGRTISEWVREGNDVAKNPRISLEIIEKLAGGLQAAHKMGILHRDIKPGNTLITNQNEPYLIDFGMARRMDRTETLLTVSGAIVGTPAYMAPEQINGSDPTKIGPAADIYSLGVIMYELLTGTIPFSGSMPTMLGSIVANRPTPIGVHSPGIDPRIEQICRKSMAKIPRDRFHSAAEFAAEIRKYLDGDLHRANGVPETALSEEDAKEEATESAVKKIWKRITG